MEPQSGYQVRHGPQVVVGRPTTHVLSEGLEVME